MQSVRDVAGVSSVRDANAAKEFLFHVNCRMGIVNSVLIAVGERTPTHADDGRIAQILRNPLAVGEILFQGLRLNEKALGDAHAPDSRWSPPRSRTFGPRCARTPPDMSF